MVVHLQAKYARKQRRTGQVPKAVEQTPGLHLASLTGPPQEVRDVFGLAESFGRDDIEGMEVVDVYSLYGSVNLSVMGLQQSL